MVKVYGIPNCDTVKKTLKWMQGNNISFEFHDYKKQGITAGKIKEWSKAVGWVALFNKKSSTWKKLKAEGQKDVNTMAAVIPLMQEHTSIIKRPVVDVNGIILVGFNEAVYEQAFDL